MGGIIKQQQITQAIFIDDSVKHLEGCRKILNLQTYLAGWGYVSGNAKVEIFDINKITSIVNNFFKKSN